MDEEQHEQEEIEYVGAPTEFADAQEVPAWVANAAKILFFLPTAFVTATTIPFIMLGIVLVCCVLVGVLAKLL
jgi:hypothetical protein